MDGIDPDVLLEWLQTGAGEERDLQLTALEQLCMLLLMSDNIDRCFESCPPRTFLPALCKIFLDDSAPDNVLEVTARAITYYLDVSNECTRRITQVDGAIKAICHRLAAADMSERASKDLAEQCVKLLEHVCQRETLAVYEAGGMNSMLTLVRQQGGSIHKDTMHSAMSVVTRLCGKMEPNDSDLPQCAESLGLLLAHDDTKVAESALRCFAALTDRFLRKMMDPAELATHSNLVEHLLSTLASDAEHSPNFLSIVLSLLSNLCRGSATVTDQVLSSSHLIDAIHSVLTNKDDRCVADGLRLADLLVVLLCDGRKALPHSAPITGEPSISTQNSDRTHRHLIDAIRQKDLSALVEAVESGAVDVNFTDDVGQTLCNWASAFGSLEMVQYLCDKGADVNKGHKSSSLHYASCFGRPDIVKVLLQRGANPDLRDEDGKTALDKARERSDQDHSQVAQLLEGPSVYIHGKSDDINKSQTQCRKTSTSDLPDRELSSRVLQQLLPIFCEIFQRSLSNGVRRTSLSLLRKIVEHAQADNLKLKQNERDNSTFAEGSERLIAVVVSVLDLEDDYDGQEQVLLILSSLLKKDPEQWVAELIRLGVFERVESLAKKSLIDHDDFMGELNKASEENAYEIMARASKAISSTSESETESVSSGNLGDSEKDNSSIDGASVVSSSASTIDSSDTSSTSLFMAALTNAVSSGLPQLSKEEKRSKQVLQVNTPYKFKDWRVARGEDSFFVWNDTTALQFCFQSNGWVSYLMNGDLSVLLTNVSSSTQKNEDRVTFVTKWRKAKALWPEESGLVNLVSVPSSSKKWEVPGWEIGHTKANEMTIKSLKGSNVITMKDDMGGFVFENAEKNKQTFSPDVALPTEFHTGWSAQGVTGRRAKIRNDIQRRRVQELALELWNNHLKDARAKPREALIELQNAANIIESSVSDASRDIELYGATDLKHKHKRQPRIERVQELVAAMKVVRDSVMDDRRLSTFEFSVSGVIPVLLDVLLLVDSHPNAYPARIFMEAFSEGTALASLSTKMVAVLEANERFPQYLYDTPGGSAFGLQLLSRRIRMKLEYAGSEKEHERQLLNRSGKILKSEPVTSVKQLKQFLSKMVAKQWYDKERRGYNFVRQIQDTKGLKFNYTSDFDEEGILYWLGTNGKTSSEWVNPASVNIVQCFCSDQRQPFGKPADILSRDGNPINCHTSDDKNANFLIDLGVNIYPSAYTLRHARGYGRSALRNWLLQASKDKNVWDVLVAHADDSSLSDPGSTATWPIEDDRKKGPYRYIRISQNGKNSSGQTYYLSLSGFEIYGEIVDVVLDDFVKEEDKAKSKSSASTSKKDSSSINPDEKSPAVMQLPEGLNNNKFRCGYTVETIGKNRFGRGKQSKKELQEKDFRGVKVVRGADWRWDNQDSGFEGRIISLTDQHDWVDVLWDNGYQNSYRFGAEGRYDVKKVENASVLNTVKAKSKDLIAKSKEKREASNLSGFGTFTPFTNHSRKGVVIPFSRFRKPANTNCASAGGTSGSSSIGKKSMSTTNLVDAKEGSHTGPSVSSTGQAASAESLQHQTPSLENLLARANNHAFGRISEATEGSETPEPGCATPRAEESESLESLSANSSNVELSTSSSRSSVIEIVTDMNATSTPQSDSKMSSLSVSAPNLAAVRQRQQSNDTFEMDKTVEEDEDREDDEDDDSSHKDLAEFVDALSTHPNQCLMEKIRAALSEESGESSKDSAQSSQASFTPSSRSVTRSWRKERSSLKQKLGSYAEVLKGLMQTVMDPNNTPLEVEELLDEDDYFDEEDGNEEDMDDEFHLDVPVESLLSAFGSRNEKSYSLNWKQLSQLMGSTLESKFRECRSSSRFTRSWDEDIVLKCAFPALIPAFDPRPGRTNVNQTQEVELPSVVPEASNQKPQNDSTSLRLFLRGPNMPGISNVTVEMKDDDESVFRYVQDLINIIKWESKFERNRRVWEPTYSLIYEDSNCPPITIASDIPLESDAVPETVNECLEVIRLLARVVERLPDAQITPQVFISDKITLKLTQELSDALVVASRALPLWCERLVYTYPCLFAMETRNMYINATAYGVSRAIVWLQNRRDQVADRARGTAQGAASSATRNDRYQEYRIGRLKHERIKITRSEDVLLEQAIRLMKFHADRKAVLEIEYNGEEGTGLGPTLEFYALVAAELQRKTLALWWCDDADEHQLKIEERELDLGEGKKPPGFYVRRAGGLFPAPLPPHTEEVHRASEMFKSLGIFFAKVLQDGRLVDLPLSRPFLKMVVSPQLSVGDQPNLDRVLTLDDFEEVHPVKGGFLKELKALAQRKRAIENDSALDREAKRRKIDELKLCIHGTRCKVEDLALNFTVNPPSAVFEYDEMELIEGGADMDVTLDNVDIYVEKCTDFYLNSGIIEQMKAFREGFDKVFPLKALRSYSPEEVQRLISGEQCPEWTREDILQYTEPKLGYTKESPGFLRFVDVMVGLNAQERKNFLQFATGCSSLPPGGLANLHPRLTVVRKVESGDGSYPSVNTCVHYLKLPEYSSAEILRERLLTAVNEKGFHLN
ncbi:unnamed protein product [Auanema sp. JU1783]|nr:unnamed protein product [Auanema sp. JU1783]